MREYVGCAFNHSLVIDPDDGSITPQTEVILLVSEPKWAAEPGGYRTNRELHDMRLMCGTRGLRDLAKVLAAHADIMERIAASNQGLRFDVSDKMEAAE